LESAEHGRETQKRTHGAGRKSARLTTQPRAAQRLRREYGVGAAPVVIGRHGPTL